MNFALFFFLFMKSERKFILFFKFEKKNQFFYLKNRFTKINKTNLREKKCKYLTENSILKYQT